ncbi:hypothetical protein PJF56_01545 [Roseofilum sp. BLCC_M91]|uniref:Uncharacterized protein n=1 Tax=Roseofilum halophilum BLCC-M91 TaxID=3022259 RepID=A0ABT7BEC5_9CYAN|nr:hypothetical protein [Roseofilum halophilum]MDJ1177537.1 hypothetical protein [Roseofilum halophilum BLCC-M91]
MNVQEVLDTAHKLSLADRIYLVSQIMQGVEQETQPSVAEKIPLEDPMIGLFSGSPDLSTRCEEILHQEIKTTSGFTWKE